MQHPVMIDLTTTQDDHFQAWEDDYQPRATDWITELDFRIHEDISHRKRTQWKHSLRRARSHASVDHTQPELQSGFQSEFQSEFQIHPRRKH